MGALISTGRFVLPARQVSHVDDGVESAFFSCVRVCVCGYIYIHTYIHMCIYIFIYIYICACVCVCVAYVACAHPHTRCTLFERGFMMSRVQCCLWLFKKEKKKKIGKVKKRRKKKRNSFSFFPKSKMCV